MLFMPHPKYLVLEKTFKQSTFQNKNFRMQNTHVLTYLILK